MSSYVTIAPDGSRTVDVQSLFYDQIELVRRIARMNTAKVYAAPDGEELTIHQMVRHYPQWAARTIQEGEAAQQRIAKLEAERDSWRRVAERLEQEKVTARSERDRLIDELRDAEARNAQKLSEIAKLREALSAVAVAASDERHEGSTGERLYACRKIARAALESGDD